MARVPKLQSERRESTMTPPLIKHYEDHLGQVVAGWSADEEGRAMPFQVVRFQGPISGVNVLGTAGISSVPLVLGQGTRVLRQELVLMFRADDGAQNLPGVLQQLGTDALAKNAAYSLGEVIGPRGPIVDGATVCAFYVATPVYLPDSFQVCRETPEPVVIAWLVPITDDEAKFVRAKGREAFERALELADPDLLDLRRASIV